jgi:hypothetical protein
MFIVFDLDGTLALNKHREHFVTGPKKDWDAFFDACGGDEPNWPVISVMCALTFCRAYAGDGRVWEPNTVEIWSGRTDRVRPITEQWLERSGVPMEFLTRMRREGDFTADEVLKEQWLQERRPDLVFDDRDKVVAMWRRHGIPCFQVAEGAF